MKIKKKKNKICQNPTYSPKIDAYKLLFDENICRDVKTIKSCDKHNYIQIQVLIFE